VLATLGKLQGVDSHANLGGRKKPASRAHILHDEIVERRHNGPICFGQCVVGVALANGAGEHVYLTVWFHPENSEIKIQNESIALIKKSKLEYIKTYIDNIDEKVLIENNINTTKLYKILTEYYNLVAEEK
jgi:hypothetical protein